MTTYDARHQIYATNFMTNEESFTFSHLRCSLLDAGKRCLHFETEIEKSLLRKIFFHFLDFQAAFLHHFTLNKCLVFVFNNKKQLREKCNRKMVSILDSEVTFCFLGIGSGDRCMWSMIRSHLYTLHTSDCQTSNINPDTMLGLNAGACVYIRQLLRC